MQKTKTKVREFLNTLPPDSQADLKKLDTEISQIFKKKIMWEGIFWGGSNQKIIGYGDYSYTRSDGNIINWFVVGLALQKNYITVFINAVDGKEYLAEKYANDLGKVKVGKSSISFKKLEDINLDKLKDLLRKAKELML